MKSLFKLLLIAFLLPTISVANNDPGFKGKYTKTKTLNKEYTVNADAGLRVDNSYGNIDIVSWSENRTVIEVVITTNGNNEEKVQDKLERIDVDFSGSASLVTAKTIFKGRKNNSWSFWKKNNNVRMEINYTIKVPATNYVDLSNDYGAISINKLQGNCKISCDYGQVNIGQLMADNNYLSFDYTNNSSIEYMKSGKINADYSGFTLEKVEELELNADYTKSEILNARSIDYSNDYGKISVGGVDNITGRGDYIPLKVEELRGDMNVNSDYGSVTVKNITASAGDITIQSDYAGIKLGFDSGYNFDFFIDLSYASLSGKEDLEVMKSAKDHSSKSYSGYHGSQNSGNTININSDYGGVSLTKN
ncbi:hypothetical protein POV27_08340 [Aureisphaera galaxeae]|uniref:hypothetical protein n=1 Tax=Aureisphaera galaxeae TaxID=1538023 RepID=UPI002350463B|nr:hypothetical protein [Aureisphaera galaxeae]MDC8004059.1 hypothetical protein [Aureisphaera galaxeae]